MVGAFMAEPPLPEELETLFQWLLAKHAEERPTAAETFATLRRIAAALGEEPYTPLEICPHTPENDYQRWHGWAISYQRFELYNEALTCNDRALALRPTDADVLLNRGDILAHLGRLDEALAYSGRSLANGPATNTHRQTNVWDNRGNVLFIARRYPEAEAAYIQALRLNAESLTIWISGHTTRDNEGAPARSQGSAPRRSSTGKRG